MQRTVLPWTRYKTAWTCAIELCLYSTYAGIKAISECTQIYCVQLCCFVLILWAGFAAAHPVMQYLHAVCAARCFLLQVSTCVTDGVKVHKQPPAVLADDWAIEQ